MKNILVLGGSYFIGKTLLPILKNDFKDANIYVLNRGSRGQEKGFNYIKADRNSKDDLINVLKNKKFDYIFDISGTEKKQITNIIEILLPENIGLYIFTSSSAVYKEGQNIPFREDSYLGENTKWGNYGINKIECEEYIKEIHKKFNMKYIIIRPPYVYGKWNYVYRESYCFKRCDEQKPIIIPGDGMQQFQFINAIDLCNCMITLTKNKDSYNDIYNIGKDTITFKKWAEECVEATAKKTRIICVDYKKYGLKERDFFPFHDYQNVLDTNKLDRFFKPKIELKEGLKEAYEWYLLNKDYIDYRPYEKNEEIILEGENF